MSDLLDIFWFVVTPFVLVVTIAVIAYRFIERHIELDMKRRTERRMEVERQLRMDAIREGRLYIPQPWRITR
jgi:peptidoglycan/LPS O-acetylase OafA/YrhL